MLYVRKFDSTDHYVDGKKNTTRRLYLILIKVWHRWLMFCRQGWYRYTADIAYIFKVNIFSFFSFNAVNILQLLNYVKLSANRFAVYTVKFTSNQIKHFDRMITTTHKTLITVKGCSISITCYLYLTDIPFLF